MSFATEPKTTLAAVNDAQRKFHGQSAVTRDRVMGPKEVDYHKQAASAYGSEAASTAVTKTNNPKEQARFAGANARAAAHHGKKALGQDVRYPKAGNSQELQRSGQTVSHHDAKLGRGVLPEVNYTSKNKPPLAKPTEKSSTARAVKAGAKMTERAHTPSRVQPRDADYAAPTTDKSIRDVQEVNEKFYGGNHKGMAQDAAVLDEKSGFTGYRHSTVGHHDIYEGTGQHGGTFMTRERGQGIQNREVKIHKNKAAAVEHANLSHEERS